MRLRTALAGAWAEAPVRLWWMSALVILLIAGFLMITHLGDALADRRLIEKGHAINARVIQVEGSRIARPINRDVERLVTLIFTLPDGREIQSTRRISVNPEASVGVGTVLPIRVDPINPERWTDRTQPKAWVVEMIDVALLLPLIVLLLAIALVRRAALLRIWRNEPAAEAVVVEANHSAIAPRSRVLRLTLRGDSRVFTTLYPLRAGLPAVGETVWVVAPPGRPHKAVVAKLYL